jgi:hypothetical protein
MYRIEYPIITHFMLGTVFAQPKLVIGKEIEEDVLYQLVAQTSEKTMRVGGR